MAGKKDNKSFAANPFKSLKGFAVSSPEPPSPPPGKGPPPPDKAAEPDFVAEMQRFGVCEIEREEDLRPLPPCPPPTRPSVGKELNDEELFLASLGTMQSVFQDQYPEEELSGTVVSRRMKQVRQGKLQPEASLDLHGLTRDAVRATVRDFLVNSLHRQLTLVLLITGRGKSGGGEAVLRGEVVAMLRQEGREWVSEWAVAPRHLGADGALVVFLRKRSKV